MDKTRAAAQMASRAYTPIQRGNWVAITKKVETRRMEAFGQRAVLAIVEVA